MKQQDRPVILCVDDEPTNLRFLLEILKEDYQVYAAPSGERALHFLHYRTPNLILLDVEMPGMSGYDVIRRLKVSPQWKDIPTIFLTGLEGRNNEQTAFDLGAVDYILKPISAGIVKARAGLHIELQTYRRNLEGLVELRTNQLSWTQDCILDMMADMTSYRDNETGSHVKRTTYYAQIMVDNLAQLNHRDYPMPKEYAKSIVKSVKLHDIGKVAVPDNILLKPGRLTDEEFEQIKLHTIYGAEIIDNAIEELGDTSSFLVVAREIIIAHHEKWNGTGYPYGLREDEIPLAARIMAIADVYDALISRRPYKEGMPHEKAIAILQKDAGTHFDPTLIALTTPLFEKFREIAEQHKDAPGELKGFPT